MAKLGDGGSDGREGGLTPPLTMKHLQGAFYILVLAWLTGGTTLLLELFTHRQLT